jgi:hypothetical protein
MLVAEFDLQLEFPTTVVDGDVRCVFVGDHVVEDCESIGVARMLTLLLLLLGCPTHAPL